MVDSNPEVDEARARIEDAVAAYAAVVSEDGAPFVTGWAVVFEFTTASIDEDGQSADDVVVPLTQSRATSRGLLGLGLDHFTRAGHG